MGFVTILDDTPSGKSFSARRLEIADESITVRELILRRVRQEVEEFNRKQSDVFYGLIQPTETERVLNGYRLKTPRQLSWEDQYEKAISAFEKNGFFLIVDGYQMEGLDEVIPLKETSEVHFLKLVPLIGG
jgi:hypothetical protein